MKLLGHCVQSLHLLIIDTHSRQRIKVFNFSSVLTACALAVRPGRRTVVAASEELGLERLSPACPITEAVRKWDQAKWGQAKWDAASGSAWRGLVRPAGHAAEGSPQPC